MASGIFAVFNRRAWEADLAKRMLAGEAGVGESVARAADR